MSYLKRSPAPGETIVSAFRLHGSKWIRCWVKRKIEGTCSVHVATRRSGAAA